jgi:hypothetical protein
MILESLLAKELEPETPQEIVTLLTWARQHIAEQAEHIDAIEDELEKEIEVRFKLQHAVEHAREVIAQLSTHLLQQMPVNIELYRDFAPHINAMSAHGVEPYAKKKRKVKQ